MAKHGRCVLLVEELDGWKKRVGESGERAAEPEDFARKPSRVSCSNGRDGDRDPGKAPPHGDGCLQTNQPDGEGTEWDSCTCKILFCLIFKS